MKMSSSKKGTIRISVAEASRRGFTFFEKFRAGFTAVQQEVTAAEELTTAFEKQVNNLDVRDQETTTTAPGYFAPEIAMLDDIVNHYDKAIKLQETLAICPVNIDPMESRLLVLRERLLKLEENPHLLRAGYQPYQHQKSPQEVRQQQQQTVAPVSKSESSKMASSSNCSKRPGTPRYKSFVATPTVEIPPVISAITSTPPTLPVTTPLIQSSKSNINIPDLSSSSTSTSSSMPTTVVTNKEIANCLSRLSRWNTVTPSEDIIGSSQAVEVPAPVATLPLKPFTRSCTFVKPKTPPAPSGSTFDTPVPPLGSTSKPTMANNVPRNTTFTLGLDQQSFPYAATPIGLMNSNSSIDEQSSVLYETVEFTPGMTSRVPKHH